jgi:hypothetical protein
MKVFKNVLGEKSAIYFKKYLNYFKEIKVSFFSAGHSSDLK